MTTRFYISGIVWRAPSKDLPAEAYVDVPGWLTDDGFEDFKCRAHDAGDDDTDDEFGDSNKPRLVAVRRFKEQWDLVMRGLLAEKFGDLALSIKDFGPV
jgi:hypothetical protein